MNLIHQQVTHQKYGEGAVIRQSDSTVEVQFGENVGLKCFLYPTAFESFLVLRNPITQLALNQELLDYRQKQDDKLRLKSEAFVVEFEKQQLASTERRRAELRQRRAAAKEKKG